MRYLARTVVDTPYFSEADGRRDPALFTLECSRPALGPYTVMASLNGIGLMGWQMLVARALELPAWKTVFFNPKTDEAIVDQLIYSIEELL